MYRDPSFNQYGLFYNKFLAVADVETGGEFALNFYAHHVEYAVVGRTLGYADFSYAAFFFFHWG